LAVLVVVGRRAAVVSSRKKLAGFGT